MATNAELYVPSSPSSFSFRPLSVGMVTSETTMAMPNGSFLDVNGYDVTTKGPKKHGAWTPGLRHPTTNEPVAFPFVELDERIESFTQLFLVDGTTLELVITNRGVYFTDEYYGYQRLNWMAPYTIESYTQSATSTTMVVLGDYREHYLETDDYVIINNVTYPFAGLIVNQTQTQITFDAIPDMTGITEFDVFKAFNANDEQYVDFAISRFNLYLVDGYKQMIWKLDGISNPNGKYYLKRHIIRATSSERSVMGARSITYFAERLYFAGIIEEEFHNGTELIVKTYLNRVRWTEVLNHASSVAANYQDLTRTNGILRKILGMGTLLMAYMSDGIYYGRQTNLTSIPYVFSYIESAGISAVGMKAVSTYFDGQIFLGIDNLYQISADVQISSLGDAIASSLTDSIVEKHMSVVAVDTLRSRVLVATSTSTTANTCLWMFNYRSKAWSRNEYLNFLAPAFVTNNSYLYYGSLPVDDTYASTPLFFTTYRELLASTSAKAFYCFMGAYFMRYEDLQSTHQLVIGSVVNNFENPCELITPDFDFNEPDADKTALRVSLKITETNPSVRTVGIFYEVLASNDRGSTWRRLGRMRIKVGHDEDALNFRFMGSTIRFKFRHGYTSDSTSTDVVPFTVSEIILRLRERSIETQRDNSRT